MKRLLTNLLVVALFWPALAVAVVAATGPDLPACCRRDGQHCHAPTKNDGFHALSHPCPCCQSLPVSSMAPASCTRTAPVMVRSRLLAAQRPLIWSSRRLARLSVRAPPANAFLSGSSDPVRQDS